MTRVQTLSSLVTALLVTLAAGCAPAYRCYSGCCVNCRYCPPPPLAYAHYDGCVCHSCAASRIVTTPSPTIPPENEGGPGDQAAPY